MDSCRPFFIGRVVFFLTALLIASGCARLNSIHRTTSPYSDRAHILSIDAKQRNVISAVAKSDVDQKTYRRFCSEPPPDVFTALASSLSANLDGSVSAQQAQAVTAALKTTMSENAATIERTQTVNILREAMFRNCERYLSGAASTDEFIVQAARDQRAMVHILAIEQITGVSRAQSTALTTLAKATSSGTTEETVKILDIAHQKEVEAKEASVAAAKAAHAQAPEGDCASMPKAPNDQVTEAQLKDKKAKCASAEQAAAAHKDAAAHYATVVATVQRQGDALAAAWGAASAAQQQGAATNKDIAAVVLDIVQQNDRFNEVEMACVVRFRNRANGAEITSFDKACEGLVAQLVATREAELKQEEVEIRNDVLERVTNYEKATSDAGDVLWAYFKQGAKLDEATLDALAKKADVTLSPYHRDGLLKAKDRTQFDARLKMLPPGQVKKLKDAAQ